MASWVHLYLLCHSAFNDIDSLFFSRTAEIAIVGLQVIHPPHAYARLMVHTGFWKNLICECHNFWSSECIQP